MIIDKKKKGNITVYIVDKDYDDDKLDKVISKKLKKGQIKDIIDYDADVYTKDGKLLLKFRKNKLNKKNIDDFYDNIVDFAHSKTTTRGTASGMKTSNLAKNTAVMTNIFGFFDIISPRQRFILKQQGKTL